MNKELFHYAINHSKEIKTLESISSILTWDQETMMPHQGAEHRGNQRALLAGIIHNKKIDNQYYETLLSLDQSIERKESDEAIQINRLLEDAIKAKKLPTSFVERSTITTSQAFSVWEKAKPESAWKLFEPHLAKIVDLVRERASLLGYKNHPLDALLDEYDPGVTTKEIETLFSSCKPKLFNLLQKIKQTPFYNVEKIAVPASLETQMHLCRDLLTSIGYDWTSSRLDTAAHPFSSAAHPTDSRITIRHNHEDTLDQILSAMHEAGHSLYEMGLDQKHYGTPLGESASFSIHEGQSRLWETVIGSSEMFSHRLFAVLKQHLHTNPLQDAATLFRQVNSVQCSLIRTEADEVTYPFHVFLRFEIEKGLLEGSLSVRDVPEKWNSAMHDMLGIIPSCHKEGCLQDVHWSCGFFGYFPSYVLGSMYATSLWEAMKKDLPNAKDLIQAGLFAPIHTWLRENVWSQGRRFYSKKLIERSLGRPPSEKEYITYLEEKYLAH